MNSTNDFSPKSAGDRVKATRWWTRHFMHNRRRDWGIPWQSDEIISADARARIAASIAEFQRGESSEARTYLAKSQSYSDRVGDPTFHAASILFVREENEHAALLLRFMRMAGISPRTKSLADGIFRRLRSGGDLG